MWGGGGAGGRCLHAGQTDFSGEQRLSQLVAILVELLTQPISFGAWHLSRQFLQSRHERVGRHVAEEQLLQTVHRFTTLRQRFRRIHAFVQDSRQLLQLVRTSTLNGPPGSYCAS